MSEPQRPESNPYAHDPSQPTPTRAPGSESPAGGYAGPDGSVWQPQDERVRPGLGRRILGVVLILIGLLVLLGLLGQVATQPQPGALDPGYAIGYRLAQLFMLALAGLALFFGVRMQLARRRRR